MRVLVVDDESQFKEVLQIALTAKGHTVDCAGTVCYAINLLKKTDYDLVILDWFLPFESGKKLLDWLHDRETKPKVWVYSWIPKEKIKPFTNGSALFDKGQDSISDVLQNL